MVVAAAEAAVTAVADAAENVAALLVVAALDGEVRVAELLPAAMKLLQAWWWPAVQG